MTPKRDLMSIFTRRAVFLGGAGAVGFGVIGARLVYLQTLDPTDYSEEAQNNRFDQRPIVPPRGVIHDRFGVPLAITSPDYRVSIRPELAKKELEKVIGKVGEILGLAPEWVARRIRDAKARRPFDEVLIRQGLTWHQFSAVNVRLPELPGVIAEVGQQRFYPFTSACAHPIGYVQKASQREIERAETEMRQRQIAGAAAAARDEAEDEASIVRDARYLRHPDVRVGKAGLEAALEPDLRGDPGVRLVEVNATGREIGENDRETQAPVPGHAVVTTLDSDLQRIAMERMAGESASCVVMDIWNGDLLVLASAPGYDPNLFVNGIAADAFKALNEDPYTPLYHKATKGAYKPGSTFKIVTAIAAIEAGLDRTFRVNCPGFMPFGGRNFHCWKRGGHGSIDFHRAMKESCTVFFYNAALRAGPEKVAEVARRLGCEEVFDIDLPRSEMTKGIIPDPEWYQRIRKEPWPAGGTLNTGIGQGDVLVSPLQLAVVTARVANGGKAVRPRLIRDRAVVSAAAAAPTSLNFSQAALATVLDGLVAVCNEPGGTAFGSCGNLGLVRDPTSGRIVEAAAAPGAVRIQIAGKTGTAQVRVITAAERSVGVRRNEDLDWKLRDHALFVFYGPTDAPRYAGVVVVEHGGGGSRAAAPIAADVMRATLLSDPASRPAVTVAALEGKGTSPA
jgi:penicillin-binding protein 2